MFSRRLSIFKRGESGRSMIETIGVLAIAGLLSIGGIVGYRFALDRYRANETINELNIHSVNVATPMMRYRNAVAKFDSLPSETKFNYSLRGYNNEYIGYFVLEIGRVPDTVCRQILELGWKAPTTMTINNVVFWEDGDFVEGLSSSQVCSSGNNVMAFEFYKTLQGCLGPNCAISSETDDGGNNVRRTE